MRNYVVSLILFGFLPLIYAILYYFSDVWMYLTGDDDSDEIHMWQV